MNIEPSTNHMGRGMWLSWFSWMSLETAERIGDLATSDKEPHALAVALGKAGFDVVMVPGAPADQLTLTVGAKPAPF